jgi:hydroxymethylbilane synthase
VGQGALALEAREDDEATRAVLDALSDADAFAAVTCERAFQLELGVGCSIPAGAYARVEGATITVSGVMVGVDGSASARAALAGSDPAALGASLARTLRDERGGAALPGWA